jgi:hypothetical protein
VRARRPVVAMRWFAVASFASAASVAGLGLATARNAGFLSRYPTNVQALLTPLAYGADFPPLDEAKNQSGPLLATYGDSHAGHLQAGLRLLQEERWFRTVDIGASHRGWSDCAPIGVAWGLSRTQEAEKICQARTAENKKELETLKPDIVVLSSFWRQYDHLERLGETIDYLHRIGVRRIVIMGTVPFWPRPPQALMYEAYQADPERRVPERLLSFDRKTLEFDQQLKKIAADFGAVFISSFDVLCNEKGCLTRIGDGAKDIVQIDLTHFSAAGSWFLIRHVADQIFGANYAAAPAVEKMGPELPPPRGALLVEPASDSKN